MRSVSFTASRRVRSYGGRAASPVTASAGSKPFPTPPEPNSRAKYVASANAAKMTRTLPKRSKIRIVREYRPRTPAVDLGQAGFFFGAGVKPARRGPADAPRQAF